MDVCARVAVDVCAEAAHTQVVIVSFLEFHLREEDDVAD